MPIKRRSVSKKKAETKQTATREQSSVAFLSSNASRFHLSEDASLQSHHVLEYFRIATTSSRCHDSSRYLPLLSLSCEETLNDEGVKSLEELIKKNHQHVHLTTLRLPNNHLTSVAAGPLASILKITETLLNLDLRHNNLGSDGVAKLIQPMIEHGGDQCSLVSLNLVDNNLSRKATTPLAALLQKNTSLREIYLGHNPLKAQGMEKIANGLQANKDSKVSHLNLMATTLGGKGAGMNALIDLLSKNKTIRSLDLSSNNLKAPGAIEFSSAFLYRNQLCDLNLGRNEIGPAGVRAIANALNESRALQGHCHLQRLTLDSNQIRDEGVVYLADSLERNSTLQYLDLSWNFIFTSGAIRLANTFTINFCLKEVLLNDNKIDDEGAFALAQALGRRNSTIDKLAWQNNPRISEQGEFFLDHVFKFRESLTTWLGELDKNVEADSLMSINWWTLSPEIVITDREVGFLAQSLARHNPLMLMSIYLTGEHITDDGVQCLCEKYIAENPPLQRLYMKSLSLTNSGMTALKSALFTNSTLRILSIANCGLAGVEGAASLAMALKHNSTLERISLQGNGMDDEGFASLWNVIIPKNKSPHPSLVALNVGNNMLTDVAMAVLAETGVAPLKDLYLDGNQITDRGALDLSKAIMDNSTLKMISVTRNQLMTHRGKNTLRWFAPARVSC